MQSVIYSFVLILLITCGTNIAEEQTCQDRCVNDCKATCPDKKVCTENEIDCGEGPPNPLGHCEADRVCVAKHCECKYTFYYTLHINTLACKKIKRTKIERK